MQFTYDSGRAISRDFQQEFRGINHKARPLESELSSAINLTSAEYPALKTRRERDYITQIGRCDTPSLCPLGDGSVAYIGKGEGGNYLYVDGVKKLDLTENGIKMPQKIVRMGAQLCLFPENVVYNLADNTLKRIESVLTNRDHGSISFTPCKLDGVIATVSEREPTSAKLGDMWFDSATGKAYLCKAIADGWHKEKAIVYANNMDLQFATDRPLYAVQVSSFSGGIAEGSATLYTFNGGTYISAQTSVTISASLPKTANSGAFYLLTDSKNKTNELYQYKVGAPKWVEYETSYTRISANNVDITDFFKEGDVVEVGEFGHTRVYTAKKATDTEKGYIVVDTLDIYGEYFYAEKEVVISRKMPKGMTNIIECSNRLWATDENGVEIYACKLGDPYNWSAFTGIASDAYVINVGSGGKFTGAIAYDGYPYFFKENSIVKVYGTYPFSTYTLDCVGVVSGGEKSLAILNGSIVYKGIDGFYAYSGGYPELLSDDISDICTDKYIVTASAADSNAYYAAVQYGTLAKIYVFEKGIWHLQDAGKFEQQNRNAIVDMVYTGRGIVTAIAEEETEYPDLDYQGINAKYYLATLSGLPPKPFEEGDYTNDDLEWSFTTAKLGLALPQDKWYSHLVFRYESDTPIKVVISYDGNVTERYKLSAKATLGSEAITLSPRRSEYITITMSGKGRFTLLSISRNIEGGNAP